METDMTPPTDPMALLPCPFCAGKPHTHTTSSSDERNGYNFVASIGCDSCGAKVSVPSKQGDAGWCNEEPDDAIKRAGAKWNTRAALSASQAEGVLELLVAAGHVTAEKIQQARDILAALANPKETGR